MRSERAADDRRWEDRWYSESPPGPWLRAAAFLYAGVSGLRRGLYRCRLLPRRRVGVPVIVVGNLTAGGTGKTPLVLWLYHWLTLRGYRPGVVSRGYGGKTAHGPRLVASYADPAVAGDEPVLLASRGVQPVAVGTNRVAAARFLVREHHCDCIISDDGLQHYRLHRDVEMVVVDGARRFGNGRLLPAGPLRESVARLADVDFVVNNGARAEGEYTMQLVGDEAVSLDDHGLRQSLSDLAGRTVHAVAGIGNPDRFFNMLRNHRIVVVEHRFPDHHAYTPEDLDFGDEHPVLMTEKDAVKCTSFIAREFWYVPVDASLEPAFEEALDRRLAQL